MITLWWNTIENVMNVLIEHSQYFRNYYNQHLRQIFKSKSAASYNPNVSISIYLTTTLRIYYLSITRYSDLLFGIISRDFTNKIMAKIFSRYNRNRAKTEVIWDLAGLCRRVFCFPSFLWVVFVIAFYIIMQNMSETV